MLNFIDLSKLIVCRQKTSYPPFTHGFEKKAPSTCWWNGAIALVNVMHTVVQSRLFDYQLAQAVPLDII